MNARQDATQDRPLRLPSPIVEVFDPVPTDAQIRLFLKRDDLIDPEIPGNKWRKLRHNLEAAQRVGAGTLLTFGGAYSNHIRATARAGADHGFETIGVIRGESHLPLNPVLQSAFDSGMQITYMDRATYREKMSAPVIDSLHRKFGDFYLLPEGGSNTEAVHGCAELPEEMSADQVGDSYIFTCAVGTGGTLAGVAAGLPRKARAIGFAVLKGGDFLTDDVRRLQTAAGYHTENWHIETDYSFGGYAKRRLELDEFIEVFRQRHGITLDWVYEAKMMLGLFRMIQAGRFRPGTTLVALIAA